MRDYLTNTSQQNFLTFFSSDGVGKSNLSSTEIFVTKIVESF
jgi:hypothetical protein